MSDQPEAAPEGGAEGSDDSTNLTAYRVQLPEFEGPLDLLLHLIQQHEIDIMDIPIAFITEKYLEYVKTMEELTIDVASEYLVMAATLTHIKSKMMLPTPPEEDDTAAEIEEDPRLELVRRLLEYQRYKAVASELADRALLGRDVFARGQAAPIIDGPAPLAPVSLFKLLDAFQGILKRTTARMDHSVDLERISIADRINQLSDLLQQKQTAQFEELFESDKTRADVVITFMALLEMAKMRLVRLAQDDAYASITIQLAVIEEALEAGPSAPLLSEPADGAVTLPGPSTSEDSPEVKGSAGSSAEPSDEVVDEAASFEPSDEPDGEPEPEASLPDATEATPGSDGLTDTEPEPTAVATDRDPEPEVSLPGAAEAMPIADEPADVEPEPIAVATDRDPEVSLLDAAEAMPVADGLTDTEPEPTAEATDRELEPDADSESDAESPPTESGAADTPAPLEQSSEPASEEPPSADGND